jgi:hypothetical protein
VNRWMDGETETRGSEWDFICSRYWWGKRALCQGRSKKRRKNKAYICGKLDLKDSCASHILLLFLERASVGKEGWRITRLSHEQMRRINWTHPPRFETLSGAGCRRNHCSVRGGRKSQAGIAWKTTASAPLSCTTYNDSLAEAEAGSDYRLASLNSTG